MTTVDLNSVPPLNVTVTGDRIVLDFPPTRDLLQRIKSLPGAKFDPKSKTWSVLYRWRRQVSELLQLLREGSVQPPRDPWAEAAAKQAAERARIVDLQDRLRAALESAPRSERLSVEIGGGELVLRFPYCPPANWVVEELGGKFRGGAWRVSVTAVQPDQLANVITRIERAIVGAEEEKRRQEIDRREREQAQAEADREAGIVTVERLSEHRGDYPVGSVIFHGDRPHEVLERKPFRITDPSVLPDEFIGHDGEWGVRLRIRRLSDTEAHPHLERREQGTAQQQAKRRAVRLLADWQSRCQCPEAIDADYLRALQWRAIGGVFPVIRDTVAIDRDRGLFWSNRSDSGASDNWGNWAGGYVVCTPATATELTELDAAVTTVDYRPNYQHDHVDPETGADAKVHPSRFGRNRNFSKRWP